MHRSTRSTGLRRRRRPSLVVGLVAGLILAGPVPVSAQEVDEVGYDPSKVLVFLATVTADPQGVATADLVLPAETAPGYEIPAEGVGPTDEFRGVLATVSDDDEEAMGARLETSAGAVRIRLASAVVPAQAVDRSITATATGFKPMSSVDFFVRYPRDGTNAGIGDLGRTGSDVAGLVGIGAAMVVLGAGALWGRRQRPPHPAMCGPYRGDGTDKGR